MEVSHLQVKVTSEGVDKVSRQLGGLGNSANNAEVKVTKLTDTITKLIGLQGKLGAVQQSATSHAQNQANVFTNLHTVMGQVATNMAGITAATNALATAMQNVTTHTNATAGALQRKNHWGNVATSTLKAMATAASVYMGLNLAKNIVESADKWANMNAKLVVVTGSQRNAGRAMEDIFEVSQKLRVPLEATTQLWTRMSPAMQRMGKSGEETTRVVQSVSTALQLSGATTAEASSAMLQLSQSFNAGRLNGAEFNAIAEAAPLILEAIAQKMGKSREELKKLGSDGKITGKIMADALVDIGPKWDELFNKLPVTFGGAMTVLKNSWFRAIGEMGKDTGFNQELVKGVRVLESLIPGIARGLGEAFVGLMKWIDANKEKLGQIWDQVVGIGKDVWGIVEGFFRVMGAIGGAGENVSVVASGLFGVRLALAAIVDVVKLVSGSFVAVGADIYEFLLVPVAGVAKVLTAINETLAGANEAAAKVSRAMGNNYSADKQEAAAKSQRANAKAIDDFMMGAVSMGQKARDVQAALTEGWRTGNTEVQKVLDSTNQLTQATRKAKEAYDPSAFPGKPGGAPVDEKAAKKAQQELDKFNRSYADLNNKIKEQIELEDRLNKYGLDYDKLSKGAQERIKWESELQRLQKEGGTVAQKTHAILMSFAASELEYHEKITERKLEALRVEKAEQDAAKSKLKTLEDEAAQMEYKVQTYGMAKGAIEALELASAKQSVTELLAMEVITPHQQKMLEILQAQIAARERLAAASGDLGQLETADKLDKLLDSSKVVKFGNDFANAFGKVGKSIGGVVDAFKKMEQRQDKTNKMREEYAKLTKDDGKNAERLARIQQQEAMDTIDSYADMAGAAKGFFDEKSKGYAAMEAVEKTFRAFQMAMAIKQFATESGLITALTSIFVGAKTTETIATQATVAPTLAANATKSASNATVAASSALAAPWPLSFASFAIVIGLLAALGIGLSGGGSAPSAPTTNTGTGTVFGDSSAQSESIANSIELLEDVDRMTMRYSAQMAASLSNIEASMVGLVSLVLRNTTGLASGDNFGIQTGKISNKDNPFDLLGIMGPLDDFISNSGIVGHIHGALIRAFGSVSTEITSAGLFIQGQLSALQQGLGMQQYADVKVTERSFWGLQKDTSYQTMFSNLDPELARQFGLVLTNIVDTVEMAGENLGIPSAQIQSALNGLALNLGRIDLRGMTGEQIQERLEAVFGAAGDTIARAVIPGFDLFQKVGEGYFETVVRVSTGVEQAQYELEQLGLTAISVHSILNKQGDVGGEIVRQTIMLQEAGTGIGEIIETITGSAEDIAGVYKTLKTLREAMQDVGLTADVGVDLIRAAGGLEALQDAVASYTDNFFSEAERGAMQAQRLTDAFAELGLTMPSTKEAFRALVQSLQASGQGSLAMQIIMLSEAFAEMIDNTDSASEAVETAREALTEAYERESSALEETRQKFEDFAESMRDFRSSLIVGELSTLTNSEKYGELKSRFESTAAAAMSGDENAIANFQAIANEFLTFSREFNASGSQYVSDFNAVMGAIDAIEQYTAGRATEAEQQLTLLEQQVDGLIELNESVLTVAEAIMNLQAAVMGGTNNLIPTPTTINGGSGFLAERGYNEPPIPREQAQAVLVEEVRAMRAQIASLQEQQSAETAALIASNYDANEQNAAAINDAANSSAYSERTQVTIA